MPEVYGAPVCKTLPVRKEDEGLFTSRSFNCSRICALAKYAVKYFINPRI